MDTALSVLVTTQPFLYPLLAIFVAAILAIGSMFVLEEIAVHQKSRTENAVSQATETEIQEAFFENYRRGFGPTGEFALQGVRVPKHRAWEFHQELDAADQAIFENTKEL